jgi:hypothetical protein
MNTLGRRTVVMSSTKDSTNASTGAFVITGGLGIRNSTDAVNASNGGAMTIAGGAAISKKLIVGSDIDFGGRLLQNGAPFVGSQWDGTIGSTLSYTNGVVMEAVTAGSLVVSDISYTGNLVTDETLVNFQFGRWNELSGGELSYTDAPVTVSNLQANASVSTGTLSVSGIATLANNNVTVSTIGNLSVTGLTTLSNETVTVSTIGNLRVTGTANLTSISSGSLAITNTAGSLVLASNGNVGVGTGSPTRKLDVVGSMNVSETVVTGSPMTLRNRIINGDCRIAQRGTSVTSTSNFAFYGGPDRFKIPNGSAGGQFTQSQSTMTHDGQTKNTVRQTCNTPPTSLSSSNFWNGILQIIEGYNVEDFNGKAFTVSFVFNTNVSGTYSVSIRDKDTTDSYITTFTATANTPQRVTVSVPAGGASVQFDGSNSLGMLLCVGALNTDTFQTSTLNTWVSGNFISAAGATNWAASANGFIELTDLQVELGPVATPFEKRPYGLELSLCKRYFQILNQALGGYVAPDNFGIVKIAFDTMRASASVVNNPITLNMSGVGGFNVTISSSGNGTFQQNINLSGTIFSGFSRGSTFDINGSVWLSAEL